MGVDFEILKGRGRIKVLIFRWEENKMTEHKKMYKAGKRWVVATLTVASIAVAGTTGLPMPTRLVGLKLNR